MSEYEKLTIPKAEYFALIEIRGLPEKAHYLVSTASSDANGNYVLSGTIEAFDLLADTVIEDIDYETLPPAKLKHLEKLYKRLAPDDEYY